jgi:hypothetical protein
LNSEFTGEVRKLVFWYDEDAEFMDDVDSLNLINARVIHLAQDNQFYTKYFLECVDTTTNYLVYAPFAKPAIRENHLADTIRYSKEFFADKASLLTIDLGIDERYKPVIEQYKKFFENKKIFIKRCYKLAIKILVGCILIVFRMLLRCLEGVQKLNIFLIISIAAAVIS